jgi:tetratricopeptide (TPR) repeat protein
MLRLPTAVLTLFSMASCLWPQTDDPYAIALAEIRQEHFEAAIPILQKILTTSATDLKALNLLGIALMNLGRHEEASKQFQRMLQIHPGFPAALKNLAVDELAMGRPKQAKDHLEEAVKLVPNDSVVRFHLGQIYFDEERYAAAVVQFRAAQPGYPDRYQAGFNLVLALVRSKEYGEAIQTGEQMIAQGQQRSELYNLLSTAYTLSGRIQDAYDALRTATRIDPLAEANYLDLMSLCLEHENWDLSLQISDVALRLIPTSYKVRLQRGAVLALQGKLDGAESEFRAAIRANPDVNLPYIALAQVQIERNQPEDAARVLRERRAMEKNDFLLNWMFGEALVHEGLAADSPAEKEALQTLQDAIRINPSAAEPRALIAGLWAKRGESENAIREFEAALRIDPGDSASAYQLAVLYQKSGATKRAEELFAQVANARSQEPGQSTTPNLIRIIRGGAQ